MLSEARRLGYSETTIWRNLFPRLRSVAVYYGKKGIAVYDPETTEEYISLQKERLDLGETFIHYYKRVKSAANRLNEFYLTGTIHLNMPKHGTKYQICAENERLMDLFLNDKKYGLSTRDDVVWVVRRYLSHFEALGYSSLETVSVPQVREFILKTASEVKTSSLHNILLYLKHFHIFLKANGIPAPDCVELFSYRVYREMPIQGYVTDEELEQILRVIDTSTDIGKRDRAIILSTATIGCMFQQYQKKAGIYRHAFDGKGFHGLRRRLAKKLLVTGTPLTTITQILGHDDIKSVRQYLSLDMDNLKECALGFSGTPLERGALK